MAAAKYGNGRELVLTHTHAGVDALRRRLATFGAPEKAWRVTFKVDIPTLMVCLNHGSQKQTLDYLCIQSQEIKDVYQNEL